MTLHAATPQRNVTVANVPTPTIGSASASASTVRARSALVEHVMEAVAVPLTKQHCNAAKPDLDAQRQSLVKRELPAFVSAVDAATGERRGPFTVEELLELKKFTGYVLFIFAHWLAHVSVCLAADRMTWLMLRKLKTFFDQKHSLLLSVGEQKLREVMQRDAARYETGTFDKNGVEIAILRCVFVFVFLLVSMRAHSARGQLVQRAAICNNELRATVVGDKGGAYTKLLLVVWDVVDCQSPKNTVLLGMYRGDEHYTAIDRAFGPVFEQLHALTCEAALNIAPSPIATTTRLPITATPQPIRIRRNHKKKSKKRSPRTNQQSCRRAIQDREQRNGRFACLLYHFANSFHCSSPVDVDVGGRAIAW